MKNYFKSKKGQAALEFLTTYGWAFLVILVAIGGLSYFGVFDIGRILPDGCKLDTNLECGDIYILSAAEGADANFAVELKNNRDRQITITGFSIIEKGLTSVADTTGISECTLSGLSIPINPDQFAEITTGVPGSGIDFNDGVGGGTDACGLEQNIGEKKTFLVSFDYTVQGSAIALTSNGELTTTVQQI